MRKGEWIKYHTKSFSQGGTNKAKLLDHKNVSPQKSLSSLHKKVTLFADNEYTLAIVT